MSTGLVDIEAEIRQEHGDYWMVYVGEDRPGGSEIWVSLSREYVEHDGDGTFTMPEWYATQKELV